MSAKQPRISVVVPTLNQGDLIETCLCSVLEQGYPNVELIVVDGGSTDGTRDVLSRYEASLAVYISELDNGQSDAINKGWNRSTGSILAWLNSDDFYNPGALHRVAQEFASGRPIRVVSGGIDIVNHTGAKIGHKPTSTFDPERLLPCGIVPGQPAVFIHRSVLQTAGNLNTSLHYVMDWEFWLRIARTLPKDAFSYLTESLASSREWGGTKSSLGSVRYAQEYRRVLDSVFSEVGLDPNLARLRPMAYSRTWWRQAFAEYRDGTRGRALGSLVRALRTSPRSYTAKQVVTALAILLLKPRSLHLRAPRQEHSS
jgi:glycosyltransferase involved in cell wall biosynthesis